MNESAWRADWEDRNVKEATIPSSPELEHLVEIQKKKKKNHQQNKHILQRVKKKEKNGDG